MTRRLRTRKFTNQGQHRHKDRAGGNFGFPEKNTAGIVQKTVNNQGKLGKTHADDVTGILEADAVSDGNLLLKINKN